MGLSKTAKASMVKEVKKNEVETPEDSIRKLRNDLGAGLYVPAHRIKVLLDTYDELTKAHKVSEEAYEKLDGLYDALDGTLGRANMDLRD